MSMLEIPAADVQSQLDQYAELLVRIGANVQPGQRLLIGGGPEAFWAPVECADFVATLVEKAYDAGAGKVQVTWFEPRIAQLTMRHAPLDELGSYPPWLASSFMGLVEQDAAVLLLYPPDPSLYNGVDPERVALAARAETEATHPFMHAVHGTFSVNWTLGAVATRAWARLLFPQLAIDEALERTWKAIFQATRVEVNDTVGAWREHLNQLGRREASLNQAGIRKLHYQAPGTDLEIGLIPGSRWMSCANVRSGSGVQCVPNIPSDEVFTTPLRTSVNGVVRSTLPLNYNGVLIENIALRFEDGQVVEASADTELDVLLGLLDTDANARYLGEVALVPADAPLARMGTTFYNTLFDENASCHLAVGYGFAPTIEGGTAMSEEELLARGLNQSTTHVDFMIGSDQLDVDGITAAGKRVPLLRQGLWAYPAGSVGNSVAGTTLD